MKIFKYGFFAKFIYRYANFPLTAFLFIYLLVSLIGISHYWVYIFVLLINVVLIYLLNRFYFKLYKTFPFTIEVDNKKITCSNFMNKQKKIEFNISEVDKIKGGIFDGNPARLIYLYASKKNISIAFNSHIKGFNELLTIILSNINRTLYNELLAKMGKLKDMKLKKGGK